MTVLNILYSLVILINTETMKLMYNWSFLFVVLAQANTLVEIIENNPTTFLQIIILSSIMYVISNNNHYYSLLWLSIIINWLDV